MKRDSLEGSAHTPMYNPNILPLREQFFYPCCLEWSFINLNAAFECFKAQASLKNFIKFDRFETRKKRWRFMKSWYWDLSEILIILVPIISGQTSLGSILEKEICTPPPLHKNMYNIFWSFSSPFKTYNNLFFYLFFSLCFSVVRLG